ncbi:MAG: AAA family ATPase [Acidobacteria bacterium]|nr:AAA family ATPase [Acidobacteriota bacterium]
MMNADARSTSAEGSDPPRELVITLFPSLTQLRGRRVRISWVTLLRTLSRPKVRTGKNGRLFSGAVFMGNYRRAEDAVEFSLLIFDCDNKVTEEALSPLRTHKLAFACYTTHSHRRITESNPEAGPRFRLIIPLAEPIPAAAYPGLWDWASTLLGRRFDASCKDAACAFFLPTLRMAEASFEFECGEGNALDWRAAIAAGEYTSSRHETRSHRSPGRDFQVRCLAEVEPEQVEWLWHPYIPFGKLTILEGDPGLGKSWMTCAIATAVAKGEGLPEMSPIEPRNVVLLSAEDGLGDTVRPRLDLLGADLHRIFAVDGALTFDEIGCLMLEEVIAEHQAQLVIIDPIVAYIGAEVDLHRANETRAVMARLARIAERNGCAILSLRHLTKGTGGKAIYRGYGSIDITAAARSVLLVGADPDDESRRAVVQTKSNLAPKGPAIGYRLNAEGFFWTGESDLTADRILNSYAREMGGSSGDAISFLRDSLAEGERAAREVMREARDLGITEKMLRLAREKLGIKPVKRGGYFGNESKGHNNSGWFWKLPGDTSGTTEDAAEGAHEPRPGHLQQNGIHNGVYGNNFTEGALASLSGCLQSHSGQLDPDGIGLIDAPSPLAGQPGVECQDDSREAGRRDKAADEKAQRRRRIRDTRD